MNNQFDGSALNEADINDVETARKALRWTLDKIRALQEETLRVKQKLQEKTARTDFLESQLKGKSSELEKILHSHEDEIKSRRDSLEYQFRSKLDRLAEREKELEDKVYKQEEILKHKENKLLDDYQKQSEELRVRWTQAEAELLKLSQEQMIKQQEFERLCAIKSEDERRAAAAETESIRAGLEKACSDRLSEFKKRENSVTEEFKKQEAVLGWARDSFQSEVAEREKVLEQKGLEMEKKLLEKNREVEEYKVTVGLLEKQLCDLPETLRKRDEDLNRYKQAMESLESVIRALETEKKSFQADAEHKLFCLNESLEAEKARYREMEADIPKRLNAAIEHERGRLAERLSEMEDDHKEDLRKRNEEIGCLEKAVKTADENRKTLQNERDAFSHRVEHLQTQCAIRQDEFSFREKQLQSEYDVRLKVEIEKQTAALKNEIESAYRIYEDNLQLKVKEISHLRRELEEAVNDKTAFQTQAAESRRAIDAVNAKAETDLTELRAQLKSAYERQLSEELAEAGSRQAAKKKKLAEVFAEQLNNVRLEVSRKEDEVLRLRTEIARLEDEKQVSAAEERQRGKTELQAQAGSFANTVKIYEEKILQFNKTMEFLKSEEEDAILLERKRLERLYSERERDFDERLARKDAEIARLKEEARALLNKCGDSAG